MPSAWGTNSTTMTGTFAAAVPFDGLPLIAPVLGSIVIQQGKSPPFSAMAVIIWPFGAGAICGRKTSRLGSICAETGSP
ncbi:hypothetical protein NMD1_03564 [Novosphingobium sp. MD-1]|nr:hypothetical protein NMD1_03564 [Novosphingobium sp. MD-1]